MAWRRWRSSASVDNHTQIRCCRPSLIASRCRRPGDRRRSRDGIPAAERCEPSGVEVSVRRRDKAASAPGCLPYGVFLPRLAFPVLRKLRSIGQCPATALRIVQSRQYTADVRPQQAPEMTFNADVGVEHPIYAGQVVRAEVRETGRHHRAPALARIEGSGVPLYTAGAPARAMIDIWPRLAGAPILHARANRRRARMQDMGRTRRVAAWPSRCGGYAHQPCAGEVG